MKDGDAVVFASSFPAKRPNKQHFAVCCYRFYPKHSQAKVVTCSKSIWINWVHEVANSARGQLNKENACFPRSLFAPEDSVSRDGFDRPVRRQPAHSVQ